MKTLPESPSSVWQCIKLCFVVSPQVVRNNWLNFLAAVIIGLIMQFFAGQKNILSMICYIAATLISWYFFASFFYKAYSQLKGSIVSYQQTYRTVWQRYVRLVGAYLLLYVAVIVVLGLPSIIIALLMAKISNLFWLLFIPLGFAFFWAILSLFYMMPGIIYDDLKIIAAFKYSFNLVKTHWWRNFFVLFVYSAIFTMVMSILAGLFFAFARMFGVMGSYSEILFMVVFSFFMPILVTAFMAVQYNDLKLRLAVKT